MAQQVPEETFSSPEHQAWLAERRGQHPLDPLPFMLSLPGIRTLLFSANRDALLAGATDLGPQTTSGVTSGPGNQGSSNTAHLVGQSGTSGSQLSIPRLLRFGQGSQS